MVILLSRKDEELPFLLAWLAIPEISLRAGIGRERFSIRVIIRCKVDEGIRLHSKSNEARIYELFAVTDSKGTEINLAKRKAHVERLVICIERTALFVRNEGVGIIHQAERGRLRELVVLDEECSCPGVSYVDDHVDILYLNITVFV